MLTKSLISLALAVAAVATPVSKIKRQGLGLVEQCDHEWVSVSLCDDIVIDINGLALLSRSMMVLFQLKEICKFVCLLLLIFRLIFISLV